MAGITFFLNSGLPFLTVAITISPAEAAGNLFNLAPKPLTAKMYKFLAPELSQQFKTAPVGKPNYIIGLVNIQNNK